MELIKIRPVFMASVVLVLTLAGALCLPVAAQTVKEVSPAPAVEKPITPAERPLLFSFSPDDPARADSIFFRGEGEMTEKDRAVVADAEASIGEHAAFMGLDFNQGKWSYQQVVCPALPNHLFLKYMRDNGTGDVSMFSASIPRGADGRVRIIPIQLRGYSLFSPAPINALTLSAFNHIRAEEHPDRAPDWLGTALCYAALAGGHPQAASLPGMAGDKPSNPDAPTAALDILESGGAVLSFADVSVTPRVTEWTMSFDNKGKLLKATHSPADLVKTRTLHPPAVVVPDAAPPLAEARNASAPAVVRVNPAPPPAAVPLGAQSYPVEAENAVNKLKEKASSQSH